MGHISDGPSAVATCRESPQRHRPSVAILLTATVNPGSTHLVERSDPTLRAADYRAALRFINDSRLETPIVFCENSNYDLAEIVPNWNGVGAPVECIQFQGQSFAPAIGKGRGELEILCHAVEHSMLLSKADLVLKITGRYQVRNLARLLLQLKRSSSFIVTDFRRHLTFADSRVFAFRPSFVHRYLLPFQPLLNDTQHFYFEHALARATHLAMADGNPWAPWAREPDIEGFSGTSGKRYDRRLVHRVFRASLRKLMNFGLAR
jgi:hypothetical protein